MPVHAVTDEPAFTHAEITTGVLETITRRVLERNFSSGRSGPNGSLPLGLDWYGGAVAGGRRRRVRRPSAQADLLR